MKDGRALVARLQVWLRNIIVFGLAYCELDRGGPVSRTQAPALNSPWPTSASPKTRTPTPSRK
ncbi:hypothetical protein ACFRAO_36835 [Streptomyces sp. NPDC056656]|uniref:hypothetical protein n=1 Tax=Streptomyces sp. NPDC056656 TaxID=3345895 RepID=UPI0036AEE53B